MSQASFTLHELQFAICASLFGVVSAGNRYNVGQRDVTLDRAHVHFYLFIVLVFFLFCIVVYHAHMFIVLILPAYKWLPPFAADI